MFEIPLLFKQCDGIVKRDNSGGELSFVSHNLNSFDTVDARFSTRPRIRLKSLERYILFEEKKYAKLTTELKYGQESDHFLQLFPIESTATLWNEVEGKIVQKITTRLKNELPRKRWTDID